MTRLFIALTAYFIGSFPTGVVLTRRKYGIDVREMGSGNIGATNVTRVFGWYAGVFVFLIDFFKGYLPVWYVRRVYPEDPWTVPIVGITLVVGHCYSVWLKGRGGKGVATSLGVMAAALPTAALLGALVYVLLAVLTRISAVGSLAGIGAACTYVFIAAPGSPYRCLMAGVAVLVVLRHKSNIRRLAGDLQAKLRKG